MWAFSPALASPIIVLCSSHYIRFFCSTNILTSRSLLHCYATPLIFTQLLKTCTFILFHSHPSKFAGLMASYASKPAPAKKLRQHLQDQQDPSNLDIYLSERSWYMKSWRSLGCDCNKGIKGISYVTRILASAIYKFIPTNNSQELSNEIVSPARRKTHLIAEKRVIFSTKCLNACISADYSNIEENCLRSKRNRGGTHASPATAYEFGKSNRVEVRSLRIINHGCNLQGRVSDFNFFIPALLGYSFIDLGSLINRLLQIQYFSG